MSARFFKKRDVVKGIAPGTPVFVGDQKMDHIIIRLIDYDQSNLKEAELQDINEGSDLSKTETVSWINIDGLHELEVFKNLSKVFNLHPLLVEDIVHTGQRPKIVEYDNCIYIVLKMFRYDEETKRVISEQFSMVLTEKVLLTFQEKKGDVFEPVRERIRKQKGRIRAAGIDYLAYALLDTIVDNYIFLIERIGEQIEDLDPKIMNDPGQDVLENINYFKQELNFIRRSIRPAKELVTQLARLESDFINEQTVPFLRDLQDLITHATEAIETYHVILADQLNIYHSSISNRMNDVMKVLTIFAAIFIPLTFVAGIYGTNFEYLPELHYRYSYFIFWTVLVGIAAIMLIYFRKKRWF